MTTRIASNTTPLTAFYTPDAQTQASSPALPTPRPATDSFHSATTAPSTGTVSPEDSQAFATMKERVLAQGRTKDVWLAPYAAHLDDLLAGNAPKELRELTPEGQIAYADAVVRGMSSRPNHAMRGAALNEALTEYFVKTRGEALAEKHASAWCDGKALLHSLTRSDREPQSLIAQLESALAWRHIASQTSSETLIAAYRAAPDKSDIQQRLLRALLTGTVHQVVADITLSDLLGREPGALHTFEGAAIKAMQWTHPATWGCWSDHPELAYELLHRVAQVNDRARRGEPMYAQHHDDRRSALSMLVRMGSPDLLARLGEHLGRAFEHDDHHAVDLYKSTREQLFASDRAQVDEAFTGVVYGLNKGPTFFTKYAIADILADFARYYETQPGGSPDVTRILMLNAGFGRSNRRPEADFANVSPKCAIALAKILGAWETPHEPFDVAVTQAELAVNALTAVLTRPRIDHIEALYVIEHALDHDTVAHLEQLTEDRLPAALRETSLPEQLFAACTRIAVRGDSEGAARLHDKLVARYGEIVRPTTVAALQLAHLATRIRESTDAHQHPGEDLTAQFGSRLLAFIGTHKGRFDGEALRAIEGLGASVRYGDVNESYGGYSKSEPGFVVEVFGAASAGVVALAKNEALDAAMASAGIDRIHVISPADPKRYDIYAGVNDDKMRPVLRGYDKETNGGPSTWGGEKAVAQIFEDLWREAAADAVKQLGDIPLSAIKSCFGTGQFAKEIASAATEVNPAATRLDDALVPRRTPDTTYPLEKAVAALRTLRDHGFVVVERGSMSESGKFNARVGVMSQSDFETLYRRGIGHDLCGHGHDGPTSWEIAEAMRFVEHDLGMRFVDDGAGARWEKDPDFKRRALDLRLLPTGGAPGSWSIEIERGLTQILAGKPAGRMGRAYNERDTIGRLELIEESLQRLGTVAYHKADAARLAAVFKKRAPTILADLLANAGAGREASRRMLRNFQNYNSDNGFITSLAKTFVTEHVDASVLLEAAFAARPKEGFDGEVGDLRSKAQKALVLKLAAGTLDADTRRAYVAAIRADDQMTGYVGGFSAYDLLEAVSGTRPVNVTRTAPFVVGKRPDLEAAIPDLIVLHQHAEGLRLARGHEPYTPVERQANDYLLRTILFIGGEAAKRYATSLG